MSKDLTDALDALTQSGNDGATPMPAPKARGAKSRVTSAGVDAPVQASSGESGGAGAIGDYTETAYADRQYYAVGANLPTTDGVFMFKAKPIKIIKMKDKDNKIVSLGFKSPP